MKIISTDQAPQAIGPYVQAKIANGFLLFALLPNIPLTKPYYILFSLAHLKH